jgi:hypothetical protein
MGVALPATGHYSSVVRVDSDMYFDGMLGEMKCLGWSKKSTSDFKGIR